MRWTLLFPAAVAGDLLWQTAGRVLLWFWELGGFGGDGLFTVTNAQGTSPEREVGFFGLLMAIGARPFAEELIIHVLGPIGFVYTGARVAPSHRSAASVGLAGLKVVVAAANLYWLAAYVASGHNWTDLMLPARAPAWWVAAAGVLGVPAVIILALRLRGQGSADSSLRERSQDTTVPLHQGRADDKELIDFVEGTAGTWAERLDIWNESHPFRFQKSADALRGSYRRARARRDRAT